MSAGVALARKPASREVNPLPRCEAISPPRFWRDNCAKLSAAEKDALNLINELQGEAWLKGKRCEPREEVYVRVSPAQLAAWSGVSPRVMERALSDLRAKGGIRQRSLGAGRGCEYAPDFGAIGQAKVRPIRERKEAEPRPADPLPAKLDCPLGHDCPVESVVENTAGLLVNISPPRLIESMEVKAETPESKFGGDERANGRDSGAWERVKQAAASALPGEAYRNWFARTAEASYDGERLRVRVPTPAVKEWIGDEYGDFVAAHIPAGARVEYVVSPPPGPESRTESDPSPTSTKAGMITWLETMIPFEQVMCPLPPAEAQALWLMRQKIPGHIFETAVVREAAKVKRWRFVTAHMVGPAFRGWQEKNRRRSG